MTNIISLDNPGNFLEILSAKSINHINICNSVSQARILLQHIINENKNNFSKIQNQDNVIKVQINNICTIAMLDNQIEKANALKKLLMLVENIKNNDDTQNKIFQGFYYLNQCNNQICFYHLKPHDKPTKTPNTKYNLIQKYGIIAYHICYCKSLKQYLTNWNSITLKSTPFIPRCRNETKIDKLLYSILNHEMPSLKTIYHSLQIILQKQQHHQNELDKYFKYSSIGRIDLKNLSRNISRHQHSNSMTNLSSSTRKNRKYTKMSHHFNNNKKINNYQFKNQELKPNGNHNNNNNKMAKTNHRLNNSNKKAMMDNNWYKQDIMPEYLLSKTQEFKTFNSNTNNTVINESDLIKVLQAKQKQRNSHHAQTTFKINSNQHILQSIQNLPQCHYIPIKTKGMKIHNHNIDICVKGIKCNKNMKIHSCLYTINQTVLLKDKYQINHYSNQKQQILHKLIKQQMPTNQKINNSLSTNIWQMKKTPSQTNIKKNKDPIENYSLQKKSIPLQNNIRNSEILKCQRVSEISEIQTSITNMLFLQKSINYPQISGIKSKPSIWMISVYTLMIYFYISNDQSVNQIQINRAINDTLQKFKNKIKNTNSVKPGYLSHQKQEDVQFICELNVFKLYVGQDRQKIQDICARILRKQYQKYKEQFTFTKNQQIEGNRLKNWPFAYLWLMIMKVTMREQMISIVKKRGSTAVKIVDQLWKLKHCLPIIKDYFDRQVTFSNVLYQHIQEHFGYLLVYQNIVYLFYLEAGVDEIYNYLALNKKQEMDINILYYELKKQKVVEIKTMSEQKKNSIQNPRTKYRITKTLSSYVQGTDINKIFKKKNQQRNKIYFSLQSNREKQIERLSTQVPHQTLFDTSDTIQQPTNDNFMKKALWIIDGKKSKKTTDMDAFYFKNALERQIQKDSKKYVQKYRVINANRSILHKKCYEDSRDQQYYIFQRYNTP